MNFYKFSRKLFGSFIPATCVECGEFGNNLCNKCAIKIKLIEDQVCPNCRVKSNYGEFCSERCREKIFDSKECFLDGIIVCTHYEKKGIIEKLITRFKYKFSEEIKDILCPLINGTFKRLKNFDVTASADLYFNFVIPVPLHSKREKMRGFNQAEILANSIHSQDGNSNEKIKKINILKRKYNTFPQAKLDRRGRLVNLTNAFELKITNDPENKNFDKPKTLNYHNKNFLIIDDVCTTGSTLNECARALQPLHPKKIYGLVLARG